MYLNDIKRYKKEIGRKMKQESGGWFPRVGGGRGMGQRRTTRVDGSYYDDLR